MSSSSYTEIFLENMGNKSIRQRIYASLLALGASILFARTIILLSTGFLNIVAIWVSVLLVAEMLIDLVCLTGSLRWWLSNDRGKAGLALKSGAAAALFHALDLGWSLLCRHHVCTRYHRGYSNLVVDPKVHKKTQQVLKHIK